MAGLVPAIHAAPPQNESGFGPAKGKGLLGKSFAPAARLRVFDAPNRVDGRDKPGHDAWWLIRRHLAYSGFLATDSDATTAQIFVHENSWPVNNSRVRKPRSRNAALPRREFFAQGATEGARQQSRRVVAQRPLKKARLPAISVAKGPHLVRKRFR